MEQFADSIICTLIELCLLSRLPVILRVKYKYYQRSVVLKMMPIANPKELSIGGPIIFDIIIPEVWCRFCINY